MILALLAVGCASPPSASPSARQISANNGFSFRLFQEILTEEGLEKNLFISPLSIPMILSATYNGAAGETQGAMARALGIEALSLEEVNKANAALRQSLLSLGSGVELAIANSLWARKGVRLERDFLERTRRYYGAEIKDLDFSAPGASETINRWVKEATHNKIEKIAEDEANPLTVLLLINAIYFKGQWAQAFEPGVTYDGTFHLLDGSTKDAPMMRQTGQFPYFGGEGFQAVELPYRGKGRMSMIIFLPASDSSLDAEKWAQWMAQLHEAKLHLVLPRFKVEYQLRLNEALATLGMEVAFDQGNADFSAMSKGLYINKVMHKTYVEVNEKGTEAAAVTSVEVEKSVKEEVELFIADRPFFYAIRDEETGAVLFMGTLVEPM